MQRCVLEWLATIMLRCIPTALLLSAMQVGEQLLAMHAICSHSAQYAMQVRQGVQNRLRRVERLVAVMPTMPRV